MRKQESRAPRQPLETGRNLFQRIFARLVCLALLGITFSQAISGQEHEFLKRGATQESLSSVDSVNHSNGAGVINIPIGSPVQIGGGLSFGLNLYYNSKIWDTESSRYTLPLDPTTLPLVFPSRKSRAGVGNCGGLAPGQC